jgi:hypothetical protein
MDGFGRHMEAKRHDRPGAHLGVLFSSNLRPVQGGIRAPPVVRMAPHYEGETMTKLGEVCVHGGLRRSCETCDLADDLADCEAESAAVKADNTEAAKLLAAAGGTVERLRAEMAGWENMVAVERNRTLEARAQLRAAGASIEELRDELEMVRARFAAVRGEADALAAKARAFPSGGAAPGEGTR